MTEIRLYRPSNGTEFDCFFADWCARCVEDTPAEPCGIIAAALTFNPEDAEYPSEWRFDDDGRPDCTAFNDGLRTSPTPRCKQTPDFFVARS